MTKDTAPPNEFFLRPMAATPELIDRDEKTPLASDKPTVGVVPKSLRKAGQDGRQFRHSYCGYKTCALTACTTCVFPCAICCVPCCCKLDSVLLTTIDNAKNAAYAKGKREGQVYVPGWFG